MPPELFNILFLKALLNSTFSNPLLPIGDGADNIFFALSAFQDRGLQSDSKNWFGTGIDDRDRCGVGCPERKLRNLLSVGALAPGRLHSELPVRAVAAVKNPGA